MPTPFTDVYEAFFRRITDDEYIIYTEEDTERAAQEILLSAVPHFEFPRKNLFDYTIAASGIEDTSFFNNDLTSEEINILAVLMKVEWLNLQIHCIDNIKQKSYGSDFKISSQANHLTSLQALLTKDQEEALHLQRLYKRRKVSSVLGRTRREFACGIMQAWLQHSGGKAEGRQMHSEYIPSGQRMVGSSAL